MKSRVIVSAFLTHEMTELHFNTSVLPLLFKFVGGREEADTGAEGKRREATSGRRGSTEEC